MTFGKQIARVLFRGLLGSGLFILVGLPYAHSCTPNTKIGQPLSLNQNPGDLDHIIRSLGQSPLRERTFQETYYSHMLTTPTYKEGTLISHPPNRLEKHVKIPLEESFIIDGESLLYENPSREISHTFSLQEFPALATFIMGLRALFNGNTEELRQVFVVSLSGNAHEWKLNLSPKTQHQEDGVDCIHLTGKGPYLHSIMIHETNGDRSELHLDRPGA